MLRLNKNTRFGIYAAMELAMAGDRALSVAEIARRYGISENHLAKVLQQLTRAGLTRSVRGPSGGYRLVRTAEEVTLYDLVTVFEGDHRATPQCLLKERDEDPCDIEGLCRLQSIFREMDEQIYYTMRSVSLATIVQNPAPREAPGSRAAE